MRFAVLPVPVAIQPVPVYTCIPGCVVRMVSVRPQTDPVKGSLLHGTVTEGRHQQ